VRKKKKDEKLTYYPITFFEVSIYREPGAKILQIFLPLFILGFFNLAVYFTDGDNDFGSQIGNLGTIYLAYIAFLPSIRTSIPSVSYVTFADLTVYLYLLAAFLCLSYCFTVDLLSGNSLIDTHTLRWICLATSAVL